MAVEPCIGTFARPGYALLYSLTTPFTIGRLGMCVSGVLTSLGLVALRHLATRCISRCSGHARPATHNPYACTQLYTHTT